MEQKSVKLIVAGSDWQLDFLSGYFPNLACQEIPGYQVRYAAKGSQLKWRLLRQLPGLRQAIRTEHQWLEAYSKNIPLQGILSDNRYGFWLNSVPSVILTHQLEIQTGMGRLSDFVLSKFHYRMLDNFQQTWVVDTGKDSMAGRLSHPQKKPAHTQYIGLLSQFLGTVVPDNKRQNMLFILLSGPEPQRSILSELLWQEAIAWNRPVLFVEGKKNVFRTSTHLVQHRDQLNGDALTGALKEAAMVVCRAGYSSIMDLVYLKKKAVLIPTPGQTEQEYLGAYLREKGYFPSFPQERFSLKNALQESESFPFKSLVHEASFRTFEPILHQWVQRL